jgi:hypothetical protein
MHTLWIQGQFLERLFPAMPSTSANEGAEFLPDFMTIAVDDVDEQDRAGALAAFTPFIAWLEGRKAHGTPMQDI